jgi:pimeloyl-ACP methyl ester carboxylesterase
MRVAPVVCVPLLFASVALSDDVYETYSKDKLVGSETATRPEPNAALKSRTELSVEGFKVTFMQEGRLDATGRRLVSYACDIQAPQGPARVRAKLGESGWVLDAGTGGDAPPLATKSFPEGASTIVLDNNLASHLDLLCRDLVFAGSEAASYTALVPQVLASVPLQAKRVEFAGESIRYRLDAANVLIELNCRKGDGALLDAAVPIQSARYVRKGFTPQALKAASAPADARERTTFVKGPTGELAAVLTVPKSDKAVPAVLMLSGSGPNDRDETIGPNKPFRDLALGLADSGIATLRFDKRTVNLKDPSKASTIRDEYVVDALEALKLLRATKGVDAKRLFVLGHSLGTLAAPLVATEAGDVRGLLLLAGPARPPDALLHDQIAFQMKLAGQDAATIQAEIAQVDASFARLKSDPADATAILGAPAGYWRDLLRLDLATLVRDSKLPALILQGEKDIQVSKTRDFDALRATLGEGEGRYAYKSFADLNHLLMPVTGEGTGREYGIAGHVDPAVSRTIASWIRQH